MQRVQNILGVNRINRKYQQSRLKQNYNNFALTNGNINKNSNSKREVYIKGLPRYINNKGLFNLFKMKEEYFIIIFYMTVSDFLKVLEKLNLLILEMH